MKNLNKKIIFLATVLVFSFVFTVLIFTQAQSEISSIVSESEITKSEIDIPDETSENEVPIDVIEQNPETSYIIVHALNPEGIEIASIEGVNSQSVEIYDGDTLIGYGAYNEETYNKPIAISAGVHTIKAKLNGITMEKNINIQEGQTKRLIFAFDRTEFYLADYLDSIGGSHIASISRQFTVSHYDRWWDMEISPSYGMWNAHVAGHVETGYYAKDVISQVEAYISISFSSEEFYIESYARSKVIRGDYWNIISFPALDIRAITKPNIPASNDFVVWYVQYFINGSYPKITEDIFTNPIVFINPSLNYNGYGIGVVPASRKYENLWITRAGPQIGISHYHLGYHTPTCIARATSPSKTSEDSCSFTSLVGSLQNLKMSSVPYDLIGTGIKYEENQSPIASFKLFMEREFELLELENPMVGGKIVFDGSDSYDPDGGKIVNYKWDFGDGTVVNTILPDYDSTHDVIYHTYQDPIKHTVKFTVTDDEGQTKSITREINLTLEKGDLLLRRSRNSFVPGEWSHIGMYIGEHPDEKYNKKIVESLPGGGVQISSLSNWSWPEQTFVKAIRITNNDDIRNKAVNFALSKIDQPFDWISLLLTQQKQRYGERWYCSELIWAAYLYASGNAIDLDSETCFICGDAVSPTEISLSNFIIKEIGEHLELRPETVMSSLFGAAYSPVDLVIIDPDGLILNKQKNEIPESIYDEIDINGNSDLDDFFIIPERKIGNYLIQVIPEIDALPGDTYTFEIGFKSERIILAENVPISKIPEELYLVRLTEEEIKIAPIANTSSPYETNEGTPIIFDASASYDPDGDVLQYRWDFDNDGGWDTKWSDSPTAGYTWNDDYQGIVKLEASDGELTNTATAEISVLNVAPVVEAGENRTVYAGNIVQFSSAFSDVGQIDTHIIKWDFGDGTTADNSELNPSYIYYEKGIYAVILTVEDDDGGIGVDTLIVDVQPIPAAINCDPNTLNLKSNGQWITCYIELPEGYDVWQINGSMVYLNGIPAYLSKEGWATAESNESNIKDYDNDNILERMVKFDRQVIQEILELGEQTFTLTGKVFYNAGPTDFEGKNIIRVTEKK